jgi:hypothetical protein
MVQMMNKKLIEQLLNDLCVKLGFCLPPDDIARLVNETPPSVASFVDSVFVAEGLNPEIADRHLYRQVRDMVAETFRRF